MAYNITNYFIALGVSILLSGIIIPKILLIAFRKKLFDTVDERKVHKGVVPRLGGLAFLPSLAFSYCLVAGIDCVLHPEISIPMFTQAMGITFFFVCALTLIYVVGLADDLIGVRYRAKFLIQIIVAVLLIVSGLWIKNLFGFLWIHEWPFIFGWLFTAVGIIFVINAVNLIDGIDGLASGLSIVALIWYSYVFYSIGQFTFMWVCGAVVGTLIPFFYYNVFGKASSHTKIFMGDTGSLTIGLVLVFLALAVLNVPSSGALVKMNPFVVATSPLLVPCFDVVRVFMHRIRRGRNPFEPDKCHIHHKLLAIGIKQWEALILIVATDLCFVIINAILSQDAQPTWILAIDVAIWCLLNIWLTRMIRRREAKLGEKLYD